MNLNRLIRFSVRRSDGESFDIHTNYPFFGKPTYRLIGKSGDRYELVFQNNSDTELEIVTSVDGLDVLDGKPAAISKPGYLVAPGKTLVVDGWRTSSKAVAAFRFGSVKNSYAEKKYGDTRNVGAIGIAVFNARGSHPRPFLEEENRRRKNADPFPSNSGFATPPAW